MNLASKNGTFLFKIAFYDKFFFSTVWGFIHYNTMFWMCHGTLPIRLKKCVFAQQTKSKNTQGKPRL